MLYGHKKTRVNIDLKEIYKKKKKKVRKRGTKKLVITCNTREK